MSGFHVREKTAEKKFVLDAVLEFKAEAKRNKALGHWAAYLMGLEGDAIEKYALSVIMSDMEEAGDDDVFRKLRGDLTDANTDVSDSAIRDKMAVCLAAAREEVYGD
jgi:hypothetical protein